MTDDLDLEYNYQDYAPPRHHEPFRPVPLPNYNYGVKLGPTPPPTAGPWRATSWCPHCDRHLRHYPRTPYICPGCGEEMTHRFIHDQAGEAAREWSDGVWERRSRPRPPVQPPVVSAPSPVTVVGTKVMEAGTQAPTKPRRPRRRRRPLSMGRVLWRLPLAIVLMLLDLLVMAYHWPRKRS